MFLAIGVSYFLWMHEARSASDNAASKARLENESKNMSLNLDCQGLFGRPLHGKDGLAGVTRMKHRRAGDEPIDSSPSHVCNVFGPDAAIDLDSEIQAAL